MQGTEMFRREMLEAGRELEAALEREQRLNRPCLKPDQGSPLGEWKAARRLVDRRVHEYLEAVRRYRAAVEELYDVSDAVVPRPREILRPIKV